MYIQKWKAFFFVRLLIKESMRDHELMIRPFESTGEHSYNATSVDEVFLFGWSEAGPFEFDKLLLESPRSDVCVARCTIGRFNGIL